MDIRRLLIGSALVALVGGCATYDDGYTYRPYRDGTTYSYPSYGYRSGDRVYYYDNRYHGDRYYRYYDNDRYYDGWFGRYRGPDYSFGFSYRDQH
jgi:hypothetical protein